MIYVLRGVAIRGTLE